MKSWCCESCGTDCLFDCPDRIARMERALHLIGFSHHSGLPRYGEKAALARWGLGLGELPEGYVTVEGHKVERCESAPTQDAPR